jgi:signal transduction histidine kinase
VGIGARLSLGGQNATTQVFHTGRPERIDYSGDPSGQIADVEREWGFSSAVGVPIDVEGQLWGVVTVASARERSLPANTEARLSGFTQLVATAIANAEAQAALTASRARIVAAADAARRRIERDLHDGAQQRLVSLALRLRGTVTAAMPPGAGELTAALDSVAAELGGVLDELRELARGLHPAALADGGLRPALRTLARRSAVPVRLDVGVDGRLPEQVELAAYYVVAEALTNAAKHADASVVDVRVATGEGQLWVEIRDDGRGGADPTGGSGLVGLTDRIEALGGWLSVHSPPAVGTALEVVLPLTAPRGPELPTPVPGRPDDTGADHVAEPAQPGPEQGN